MDVRVACICVCPIACVLWWWWGYFRTYKNSLGFSSAIFLFPSQYFFILEIYIICIIMFTVQNHVIIKDHDNTKEP